MRNGVVHIHRGVIWGDTGRVVKDPKSQAGKRDVNIPPHLMPVCAITWPRTPAPAGMPWCSAPRWAVAGTGPDSRYLLASRGGVTVSAWTAEDLAAEIRRQTGAH